MEKTEVLAVRINVKQLLLALGFAVASFTIPFIWGQPQLLVGTFVNFLLFAASAFLPFELLLPVVLMPSISVLARGAIFGPWTFALIWMMPFIWAGNLVMVMIFKKVKEGREGKEGIDGLVVAVFAKTALLFLAAYALFNLHAVPKIFLTSFGIVQLATALAGGGGWMAISNLKLKRG